MKHTYNSKYNFWDEQRFPGFKKNLEKVYNKSVSYYFDNLHLYDTSKMEKDYQMINKVMNYVEDYYLNLIKIGIVNRRNYQSILEQLKKIELIKIFPNAQRRLYGLTCNHKISINPEIPGKSILTSDEMQFLCVAHELGHIIDELWTNEVNKIVFDMSKDPRVNELLKQMKLSSSKYLSDGFCLLDEVIVQEVAEMLTFYITQKPTPKKEYRTDKAIFNNNPYLSNFILYGELQDFATKFARNLSFLKCDNNTSDEEVLRRLAISAFDNSFMLKVVEELKNPNKREKMIVMLACMGRIKEATYNVLGLNNSKDIDVTTYSTIFNRIHYSSTK